MINRFHSFFFTPLKGWDPVPSEHARRYAEGEWKEVDNSLVDMIEQRLGGLRDRRVLDLGGGPGQYSVAFAKRGANVTWHDVSENYRTFAADHAKKEGVSVEFSLGYLEDAIKYMDRPFDLVFSRLSWSYCMADGPFAQLFYDLVLPGMIGYIDVNTPAFAGHETWRRSIVYAVDRYMKIKIGHPYPQHGRVASLLLRHPMHRVEIDYSLPTNDRILFRKAI
jgi:SAM-dependent methyltransferase